MKQMKGRAGRQSGFTLVEIAIVLVIIGLIVGATLKGQELIFNSKVKGTYNLTRELSAAFYGYQDRYKALPGDDSAAATRFPTAAPAARNGDGDGVVWWGGDCRPGGQGGENCAAMYHLRLAGFITGTGYDGAAAPFGGTAMIGSAGVFWPNGGAAPVLGMSPWALTHKFMSAYDTSFDDGNSTTGVIRCRGLAAYDMANSGNTVPDWCSTTM